MVEPDNLVLDQFCALRGDNAKILDWMQTISAEATAIRQHLAGVVTIQELDHADIAGIKVRLDRIDSIASRSDWSWSASLPSS